MQDAGNDRDVVGDGGGGDVVQPPPGCDDKADPKDAPKCVVSAFGVFVDAIGGADANPGTKESPVKSIGAALGKLGGKARVYVCEGTYAEHVKLTSAVAIYGGFACGSWSYSGTKAKVSPTDAGYALHVDKVSSAVAIQDVAFEAAAGTAASASSIAAFVQGSAAVVLTRAQLVAGAGFDQGPAASGATGTPDKALDGDSANMATPGVLKTCTCSSGGTTSGGGGGAVVGPGQDGSPVIPPSPVGQDGKAGAANTACSAIEPPKNGSGHVGADAASALDAPGLASLGVLDGQGWTAASGSAGATGAPGQGGGGGGGRAGAGGGGACGGCGGTGGKGGAGGGSSVALLALDAPVVLLASTLTTSKGGGGGGGGGAVGGAPNGCGGGDGGKGGNGGAGAGGAGGLSVGVLYKGAKPSLSSTPVTQGDFGIKGTGGRPGTNDGIDGKKAETLEVQ